MSKANGSTAVLQAIIDYKVKSGGDSPAVRELAEITGLASTSTVSYHLDKLEAAGLIKRGEYSQARAIRVVGGKWTPPEGLGV